MHYRFFSDAPPPDSPPSLEDRAIWAQLAKESKIHSDVVLQPLPSGYGDKEHNLYAVRARYQIKWALRQMPNMTFFLRIDDDSFLCLHKLIYELKSSPREQFFWGRFWCKERRHRADENFMLFSRDVIELLADDRLTGRLLPFDDEVTLGWNFGYWSWVLNLTTFDDQKRIDAQQGYLTEYMHGDGKGEVGDFCDKHLYAHHVKEAVMTKVFEKTQTRVMYPLPLREQADEGCPGTTQSFVPKRHSAKLPDLIISRSNKAPS